MAKYAVIKVKEKQYLVQEGEEILIDKTSAKDMSAEVLLVASDSKKSVGTPTVKGGAVKLKIVEQEVKGDKIYVSVFRSKSRYRKKMGFRPRFTKVKVDKIV